MEKKKYLMDVVLIRLTLIFLLVFYHAFCPFTGAWTAPPCEDFHIIEAYKWLGLLAHKFQLESMIFISGLLFGYTLTLHPERLSFNGCIIKKVRRILLPSLLFSIVYYLLFYDLDVPVYSILLKLLNGCGHLWFLPMIFWCFVICYILERLCITPPNKILIISGIALFSPVSIPYFGLERLHNFFFFFYLGFAIKKGYITFWTAKKKQHLLSLLATYIILCISYEIITVYWQESTTLIEKGIRALILKTIHPLCALSMLVFLYSLANRPIIKNNIDKCPGLITLSGYCYGVYIYQQFILMFIYTKTDMPYWISPYFLPWVAMTLTLFLSLLLCFLTLKSKIGRFLIG